MPLMDDDLPSGLTPEEFSAWIFGADAPSGGERRGLELAPFRGVSFAPDVVGDLAAVTTPPYDLIDDASVRRLLATGSYNIVRLILPRAITPWYPPAAPDATSTPDKGATADADAAPRAPEATIAPGEDSGGGQAGPERVYREAGDTLGRWLAEGALVVDAVPALYVYEVSESRDDRARRDGAASVLQRGIIGALGLRAESERVVLPHENVYPGPVRDRFALMAAARANLEPIFTVYEGGGEATRSVDAIAEGAAPFLEVRADDGFAYRIWRVTDPTTHDRIAVDLRDRQALIADGHHRYATYRALQARHHAAGDGPGPWDYGLALLVDSTRYPPHLGAIHRVLPDLPPERAAREAVGAFRVSPWTGTLDAAVDALAALDGPAFLLVGGARIHLLTDPDPARLERAMPAGGSPLQRRLDTAVLDRLLIADAWAISEDERTVEVVHDDPAAAMERADRTGGTAVILNPLKTTDVLKVAAQGERVPRKSTSFGPKPRTGLVLRLLDPPR